MASSSFKNSGDFLRCENCNNKCIRPQSAQYDTEKWYCSRCSSQGRSAHVYPKLYSEQQDKLMLLSRSKSQMGVCTNLMKSIEGAGSGKKMFADLIVNKKSCTPKPPYRDIQFRGSLMTLSKKPVHCPCVRCHRTIAVSSVHSHFKYEHKHVPILSTTLGARNELELNPYTLEINHPTCIVLITLPQKLEKAADHDESALNPTMLLMASNIMNNKLTRGNDDDDDSDVGLAPFDKIIFWICSNILTQSKCTLAISTICKSIRIKYYGPISPINDNYIKLYQEGKGLILHQLQILNMTNYGKKRLAIDVIIHKEQ
ncbi:uncharacterized protein LOC116172228 [Photinus pyralis]|nr:uncharacterized protein LOC116172228 [Photinus pyralis]